MRIWKEIWDYAKMIIIVVVIVTLVNSVVLINAKIPSESMEKTIMTGDRIFGSALHMDSIWISSDMKYQKK